MESRCKIVKLLESARDSRVIITPVKELLNGSDTVFDNFADGKVPPNALALGYIEDELLRLIHNLVGILVCIVTERDRIRGGSDQFTKQTFLLHNLCVILRVRRCGCFVQQRGYIHHTAGTVELSAPAQKIGQCNNVNGGGPAVEFEKGFKNNPVLFAVKILFRQYIYGDFNRFLVKQHAAETCPFCFKVLRRKFVSQRGELL